MIQDNDEDIVRNQEQLGKFYRAIRSQVKLYFLSKQVMSVGVLTLEYSEIDERGCFYTHGLPIFMPADIWINTPLIDLFPIYLKAAWDQFLEAIKRWSLDQIYVKYAHEVSRYRYNDWIDDEEARKRMEREYNREAMDYMYGS